MTKEINIKAVRKSLGLSSRAFASLIGYQDDRTIRRIESGEQSLSGSADKLLTYIMQGVNIDIPIHMICAPADRSGRHGECEFLLRTHRPRFLATIDDCAAPDHDHIELANGAEFLNVILWIDEPQEFDVDDLLRRAATDFEIYTQDSFMGIAP